MSVCRAAWCAGIRNERREKRFLGIRDAPRVQQHGGAAVGRLGTVARRLRQIALLHPSRTRVHRLRLLLAAEHSSLEQGLALVPVGFAAARGRGASGVSIVKASRKRLDRRGQLFRRRAWGRTAGGVGGDATGVALEVVALGVLVLPPAVGTAAAAWRRQWQGRRGRRRWCGWRATPRILSRPKGKLRCDRTRLQLVDTHTVHIAATQHQHRHRAPEPFMPGARRCDGAYVRDAAPAPAAGRPRPASVELLQHLVDDAHSRQSTPLPCSARRRGHHQLALWLPPPACPQPLARTWRRTTPLPPLAVTRAAAPCAREC